MRDSISEVLRTIATDGPLSRAELARKLGLSGPTLTQATKFLIQGGLVHELEQTPSTGGRPATLLGLVANAGQILGLKLSSTLVTGVCVDLESNIIWKFEEPFTSKGQEAVSGLAELLKKYTAQVTGRLLGVGIGIPGVVSPKDGMTAKSVMLGWDDVPVGHLLSEVLGVPVLLQNDVNTLAMSEALYGQGRAVSDFLTITVGRGIGMGIVINGELFNGTHGAGEFGHVNVPGNLQTCECGKAGCLESLASDHAIWAHAVEIGVVSGEESISQVWAAAREDEISAEQIFREPFEALGTSLANVVNVLGSELIIISGEGAQAWDIWGDWLQGAFIKNLVSTMADVRIIVDPWDDQKWALGATAVVLEASLRTGPSENLASMQVRNRLNNSAKGAFN